MVTAINFVNCFCRPIVGLYLDLVTRKNDLKKDANLLLKYNARVEASVTKQRSRESCLSSQHKSRDDEEEIQEERDTSEKIEETLHKSK